MRQLYKALLKNPCRDSYSSRGGLVLPLSARKDDSRSAPVAGGGRLWGGCRKIDFGRGRCYKGRAVIKAAFFIMILRGQSVQCEWRRSYDRLVPMLIKEHFGDPGALTRQFPYMKATFPWKGDDFIITPQVLANPDNGYHGVERLAMAHHQAGAWQLAGEYWLIAAGWRRNRMDASDERHVAALQFVLRHVEYNRALAEWKKKKRSRSAMPYPEQFGLSDGMSPHDT